MPTVFGPTQAAVWLALILLSGYLLYVGRAVLIPLALAILIWQLINAVTARLDRIRIAGRPLTAWQRLLLGAGVVALALWLVVDLILRNVGAVSASAPTLEANLLLLLPRIAGLFGFTAPASLGDLMGQIRLDVLIRSISSSLAGFAGSIGLIALYVAFMMFERETFARKVDALFPAPGRAERVRAALHDIETRVERYLYIKTLMSIATALLSWGALVLIGCANASFWALLIFMLNYIPVVGALLSVLFPALLVLVQFAAFPPFFLTIISLTVIQVMISSVLEPRLMGSSLNLSPLAIMVALAVWGALWGIPGMFLCVPITVIMLIVCAQFDATRPIAILLSAEGRLEPAPPREPPVG